MQICWSYIRSIIISVATISLYKNERFNPFVLHLAEHLIPLISRINRIRIVIKASLRVRYTYEVNSEICSNINKILAFTIDNIMLRSRKDLTHINVLTIEYRLHVSICSGGKEGK